MTDFEEKRQEIIKQCKARMKADNVADIQSVCLWAMQWRKLENTELDIIAGHFGKSHKYNVKYTMGSAIVSLAPSDFWKQIKLIGISALLGAALSLGVQRLNNQQERQEAEQQRLRLQDLGDSLKTLQKYVDDNLKSEKAVKQDSLQ